MIRTTLASVVIAALALLGSVQASATTALLVPLQPLAQQAHQIENVLAYLGQPLSAEEISRIDEAVAEASDAQAVERLQRGGVAADVGCGGGRAAILMAQAFPNSRVFGFDLHAESIERAQRNAAAAGLADRVTFEVANGTQLPAGKFDLVTTFDVVHDSVDPVGLMSSIRRSLTAGGTYLVQEINVSSKVEENVKPMGKLIYSVSTLYCMTTSLAHGGAVRMYNLMIRAAQDFDLVVVSFAGEAPEAPAELLDICCEVVLVSRSGSHLLPSTDRPDVVEEFDSPAFHAAVRQTVRKWRPGVVQLEFTQMAQYAADCAPAKTILVEHDVTLDLYQQLLAQGDDWELRHQLERWIPFEIAAWSIVDPTSTNCRGLHMRRGPVYRAPEYTST